MYSTPKNIPLSQSEHVEYDFLEKNNPLISSLYSVKREVSGRLEFNWIFPFSPYTPVLLEMLS